MSSERPKTRGRPPKYYHPLLQKEKTVTSTVRRILPEDIAESVRPSGSRLAHLYGLPKTHKAKLAMRPILSASATYNYDLAKWLDGKLKVLSYNGNTVHDTLLFAEEVRKEKINEGELLVSYDVASLFTSIPLDETIQILANKAFENNWFNLTYNLNISKDDLIELLTISTKDQLFQFNGQLYEQIDGVAMGSPLGPLLANVFMCHIEDILQHDGKLPAYYKRYVDDTLTIMPDSDTADNFLKELNQVHTSLKFTKEVEENGTLPFLGILLLNRAPNIDTKVHVKPTNTGLLLHYQSHVDERYKRNLISTMLERGYRISSSWKEFSEECNRLKDLFKKLKYPDDLVSSITRRFIDLKNREQVNSPTTNDKDTVRIILPFKDQRSADRVKKQVSELSNKVLLSIQPIFVSDNIGAALKVKERKPPLVNSQRAVYEFQCDLCDTSYIGYTKRHLYERVEEHKHSQQSSIYKHYASDHATTPGDLLSNINVLKKCKNKFECLVFEMLYIQSKKPPLNVQTDSLKAKLFL